MNKLMQALAIAALASITACSTTKQQAASEKAFNTAEKHYQHANYEASFKAMLPAARAGDPKAQYALGYMYYYGRGVKQDMTVAKIWIRNAAKQGYEPARKALGLISNYDSTFVAGTPHIHIEPAQPLQ